MNTLKNKIIIAAVLLGIVVIFIIMSGLLPKPAAQKPAEQKPVQAENDSPKVVSTKPDPLDNNIISAADVIEITFNKPLQNVGEFKSRIEPNIDYKVELSSDRKTAKIITAKPYDLGATYTLFIGPDTKFDGTGNWGQEKVFQFRTIKYTGV